MEKPVLIVVALGISSDAGSEPGKAWVWANALARFYRLEVLTLPGDSRRLEERGAPYGWHFHGVGEDFSPGPARKYYAAYRRWCVQALEVCHELVRTRAVIGLHHITLGSFRVLPRYDLLGIPYTLGPLGGGESIPWLLLPQLRLPFKEIVAEALRLPINYASAAMPSLRAVFRHAGMTLATTHQSRAVVAAIGARRSAAIFPDAFVDPGEDDEVVLHRREQQAATLSEEFRCVCAGRSLWWKGIHLAIDFIRYVRDRGINARLDIFSEGKALAGWQARATRLGLSADVTFHAMIGRNDLMRRYAGFHLFLNPTMHDSSSPALVEAYSTGLPSMTLGLAGSAQVATAETGVNTPVTTVENWLEKGCQAVVAWTQDPSTWLRVCRAAKARAHDFDLAYLERCVREHLNPVFLPPAP